MTQQRYRDLAEWPLMGTAVVFPAACRQIVARVEGPVGEWLEAALWITWGIFAADYAVNLWLADDRRGVVSVEPP